MEKIDGNRHYEHPRDFIDDELDVIAKRRNRLSRGLSGCPDGAQERNGKEDARYTLFGLSLSGGGIRSCLFNLGILQEMSRLGLLKAVDILSTVSGGGYIGGCLSSLLSLRDPGNGLLEDDDIFEFKQKKDRPLFDTDWEGFPFRDRHPAEKVDECRPPGDASSWLCRFGPRTQMRHLRNHANYLLPGGTNLFELLRSTGAVVFHSLAPLAWFLSLLTMVVMVSMGCISQVMSLSHAQVPAFVLYKDFTWHSIVSFFQSCWQVYWASFNLPGSILIVFLGFLFFMLSILDWKIFFPRGKYNNKEVHHFGGAGHLFSLVALVVIILASLAVSAWIEGNMRNTGQLTGNAPGFLVGPFVLFSLCLVFALLLHCFKSRGFRITKLKEHSFYFVRGGALAFLVAFCLFLSVFPVLVKETHFLLVAGFQAILALGTRYLIGLESGKKVSLAPGSLLLKAKAVVFSVLAGLLFLVFVLLVGRAADLVAWQGNWLAAPVEHARFWMMFDVAAGLFILLSYFTNFNKVSNGYFYGERLAEAFLQTSSLCPGGCKDRKRELCIIRKVIDMKLSQLHGSSNGQVAAMGPYHIISCTLNLTAAHDLKGLRRRSEPFEFSRLYSGSRRTCYVKTADCYENMDLIRALTISGAAVSSVMGAHTNRLTSFACTLLGVRLGQWVVHPMASDCAKKHGIKQWIRPLWDELTGNTDATGDYVYLSDGGHSGDNLGILPLLRRRARFVVVSDAECDGQYFFDSLNSSLRQAYVDEGIKVDIDIPDDEFEVDKRGYTKSHFLLGRILYPDRPWQPSWMIVLKSSLTGDELATILNYKKRAKDFPHETTANQFFTEEQFEAYRALGRHIVSKTFLPVMDEERFRQGLGCYRPWFHLEEIFRKAWEGKTSKEEDDGKGNKTGQQQGGQNQGERVHAHRWDDLLQAMWDCEQVNFSSWHAFHDDVERMAAGLEPEDLERVFGKCSTVKQLLELAQWLREADLAAITAPVPRSWERFRQLKDGTSGTTDDAG